MKTNNPKPFSINDRIKSFGYALQGLKSFFKTQHNAWIHVAATVVVIVAGFVFKVSLMEWIALSFAIALVFISELFNTAIEFLCDKISPELDPRIKLVKDISAAAVLIAAIVAVVVGAIVFVPKVF
ncbi:MAG: diacylglycerol kinase family protein [Bacteroidetes bacterium]|nr:diacylglycerol kinase family protein [Bacteroidota bacterium]